MALTTRPTDKQNPEDKDRDPREQRLAEREREQDQRQRDRDQDQRQREYQREERDRDPREGARQGEQSRPSGRQDSTLPGSTPETSTQMPEPGKSSDKGGKSPLKFDPNAPPVDTVAQKNKLRVEGGLEEGKRPEQQIHSSQIPPERDPEQAWEEHARYAINGLYPRLREGVDWAIGRKSEEEPLELLEGEKAGVDWGKVQEAAKKLAYQNPYTDYKAKPGLGQTRDEGFDLGERHKEAPNKELPPNVAQSEVNPKTQDKVPSQAYQPQPTPLPAEGNAQIKRDDPNFNPDGSRKRPPEEGYDQE